MNIIEDDQSPILYGGFFPTKSPVPPVPPASAPPARVE